VQLRRIALAASLAVLAACDKSTDPNAVVSGNFHFDFAGGISGSYSADGSFPTNPSQQATFEWAAGEVSSADGGTWVAAAVPVNSTTHNYAFIFAPRMTAGSSTITSGCVGNACADMGFLFQANNSTFQPAQTCFLTSGTINFTTISSTRIIGTFSGTGNCVSSGGVTTSFTVTNGTFDVPAVAGVA
jgi:hypothetical protein